MSNGVLSGRPLNAFSLLSHGDAQLEKFHSRVLAGLMDGRQSSAGAQILDQFLQLISQKAARNDLSRSIASFRDSVRSGCAGIEVEYSIEGEGTTRFADIVIFDAGNHKVILVENKINNALDMHRQIPFYISGLKRKGFETCAVVYLKAKDPNGFPCTDGWSEEEIVQVRRLMVPLSANNSTDAFSLVSGVFQKFLARSDVTDTDRNVICQYVDFLCDGMNEVDNLKRKCAEIFGEKDSFELNEVAVNLLHRVVHLVVDKGSRLGFGKGKVTANVSYLWDFWLLITDDYKVELAFDLKTDAASGIVIDMFVRTDCRSVLRNSLHGVANLFSSNEPRPSLEQLRKRGQYLRWNFPASRFAQLDAAVARIEQIIARVCNSRDTIVTYVRERMDARPI